MFLATLAIPTCPLQPHISYHLAPPCVFSSGIPPTINDIDVSTFIPTGSSSLVMLSLMRRYFPSPICPLHPRIPPHLIFWMTLMIPLHPVGQEFCMQVPIFLAAWMPPRGAQAAAASRLRHQPQALPVAPSHAGRPVLLPLWTPRPRSLQAMPVAPPAAPLPWRPRRSSLSPMRTACAHVARMVFAIPSIA